MLIGMPFNNYLSNLTGLNIFHPPFPYVQLSGKIPIPKPLEGKGDNAVRRLVLTNVLRRYQGVVWAFDMLVGEARRVVERERKVRRCAEESRGISGQVCKFR